MEQSWERLGSLVLRTSLPLLGLLQWVPCLAAGKMGSAGGETLRATS